MGPPLAEAFRVDLGCDEATADLLARLSRERIPRIANAPDDQEGDILHRLRDPRILGEFVRSLIDDMGLPEATRIALADHAFNLLPLPRGEADLIFIESRAPTDLLSLAAFLARHGALTVLHMMHLVYAVYLDRALVTKVSRAVRSAVLAAVVAHPEATDHLRVLYTAMHLSAIPEAEAHGELRRILRDPRVFETTKDVLAGLAAADDGGFATLARVAQDEGLLPADAEDLRAPSIVANIPRMHARLAAAGRRWLLKRR